jgi:hypothetical protein
LLVVKQTGTAAGIFLGFFGAQGGVYSILTDDIVMTPRPFRVLYFARLRTG